MDYTTQPGVDICEFGLRLATNDSYYKDIGKGDIILLLYEVITQKTYLVPYVNHGGSTSGSVELSNGVNIALVGYNSNNVNDSYNMTDGKFKIRISTNSVEDEPFQLTIAGIVRK